MSSLVGCRLRNVLSRTRLTQSATLSSTSLRSQEEKEKGISVQKTGNETLAADIVSGAPQDIHHRVVRIYRPAKTTMQSGTNNTNHWKLDWDILSSASKWQNPLMGWASSGDATQATSLKFRTSKDAVAFAEKQGWSYILDQESVSHFKPKSYSDNYLHSPGKLRLQHTK